MPVSGGLDVALRPIAPILRVEWVFRQGGPSHLSARAVGWVAQRGLGVLPNQGGGRRPGDIRGAIQPVALGPHKPRLWFSTGIAYRYSAGEGDAWFYDLVTRASRRLASDSSATMKKITVEMAAARPKFWPESWKAMR